MEFRVRYPFSPITAHPQDRLRIYLILLSNTPSDVDLAKMLLLESPLRKMYRLKGIDTLPESVVTMPHACDIVRRVEYVESLVGPHDNFEAPEAYLFPNVMAPRQGIPAIGWEAVLDGLDVPVIAEIGVQPVNVTRERDNATRELKRLDELRHPPRFSPDSAHHELTGYRSDSIPIEANRKPDPRAEQLYRDMRDFTDQLRESHLSFYARVSAPDATVARVVAMSWAEDAFENGSYHIEESTRGPAVDEHGEAKPLALNALGSWDGVAKGDRRRYKELQRISHCATVDELSSLFRLPVGGNVSPPCIRMNTDPPVASNEDLLVAGHEEISTILPSVARGPRWRDLPKHIGAFGLPGGGKSIFLLNVAASLANGAKGGLSDTELGQDCDVPFIFIAPRKREFRNVKRYRNSERPWLRKLANNMHVITVGAGAVDAFGFNPLAYEGISGVEERKQAFLEGLRAAIPLGGPLESLLMEALDRVYDRFPKSDFPPTVLDLYHECEQMLGDTKYSKDTRDDLGQALMTRLRRLTRGNLGSFLLCRRSSFDMDALCRSQVLLELDALTEDEAAVVSLWFLTAVREFIRNTPWGGTGVRLGVILEEAHVLLGGIGEAGVSEIAPNPKAHATEFILKLLVEMRSLGVACVVADQLPSAISPLVLKSVASLVVFRETAEDEREVLAGTSLMDPHQTEELARFGPGDAFFMTEGYYGPRRIRTVNLSYDVDLAYHVSDAELRELMCDEAWFQVAARRKVSSLIIQVEEAIASAHRYFDELREFVENQLAAPTAETGNGQAQELLARARTARRLLGDRAYRLMLETAAEVVLPGETTEARIEKTRDRYDRALRKKLDQYENIINRRLKVSSNPAQ